MDEGTRPRAAVPRAEVRRSTLGERHNNLTKNVLKIWISYCALHPVAGSKKELKIGHVGHKVAIFSVHYKVLHQSLVRAASIPTPTISICALVFIAGNPNCQYIPPTPSHGHSNPQET